VKFPYVGLPTRRPVFPLGGIHVRHRPLVPVHIIRPQVLAPLDACIDSASDDTVFPERLARRLGIELTGAPQGEAQVVGSTPFPVRYAQVTLLLADGFETCEWEAIVGFTAAPLRWPLLGQAGVLEYFDTNLLGARREVILQPNLAFRCQHVVHRPAPP
jgi:hypothetical protein